MKITLSCLLLLFISTSVFSQKIQWYNKEERQKQLYENQEKAKQDPLTDYLYIPIEDMTLMDQYSIRMQKSGRQLTATSGLIIVGMIAGASNALDLGNINLAVGSGIVGFGCAIGAVINLANAGVNLRKAGVLYKQHHLQLQLEATQNGIGMVMRF